MQIFTCKGVKSRGLKIYEIIYGECPISNLDIFSFSSHLLSLMISHASLFSPHGDDGGIGDRDDNGVAAAIVHSIC